MALFKYRAVDSDGKTVEGTMEEVSASRVTTILRERGLQVSAVDEVGKGPGFLPVRSRLTWDDLDLLTGDLLAITKSGRPLGPSLKAIAEDTRNRRLKRVLDDIRSQIESGSSLEAALSSHPGSFPPVYTSVIQAGERSGNLSGALSHLSAYSARMVEMKNSVQQALAYPILVLAVACGVLGFLLVKIVPGLGMAFTEFGIGLPCATRLWVNLSNFIVSHLIAVVACSVMVLIAVYLLFTRLSRSQSGRYALDWIKLHVPVFSTLYSTNSLARFSRSTGLLLASEVPVLESLDLASAAAGNSVLRRAVTDAARFVEGGKSLSDSLASTGYFGYGFCWMVGTGEERGEVDGAFLSLADTYETGTGQSGRPAAVAVGHALIVCAVAIVGFLVISMCLPILPFGGWIGGG